MPALGEALKPHHALNETLWETSTAVTAFDGPLPVARLNELVVGIRKGEGEEGDTAPSKSHFCTEEVHEILIFSQYLKPKKGIKFKQARSSP